MTPRYAKDQLSGFVNQIRNVAIVGAGGQVGTHITTSLLQTNQHTITAITRPESNSTFPSGVKIAKVNYDDHTSLVHALRNQDALIITMKNTAPADTSTKLIHAAIEAGVPWILPNEYGSDYTDASINNDTRVGSSQIEIRKLIETHGSPGTAFIAVACGFWYEYCLAGGKWSLGFDFANKEATFYDDGDFRMNYSTLAYCGYAVAKLLCLPVLPVDENDVGKPCLEDYRNGIFPVRAFNLSQRDMFESVLRVIGDKEGDWTVKSESSKERFEEGKRLLDGGKLIGWRLMLFARMFFPGTRVNRPEEYQDERLGLVKPELDDATKWAVENAE